MKVLFILGSNPSISPYIFPYLRLFLKGKCVSHLLFWNRKNKKECLPSKIVVHSFDKPISDYASFFKKMPLFIKFRQFAVKTIKKHNYDFVVVFDTQFAVLLSSYLIKHFKKKYIFDMRDLSYEKNLLYKRIMNRIKDNSCSTFVSSDGFRVFFKTQDNIYTFHNVQKEDIKPTMALPLKGKVISISFWGLLRDYELNVKLVNLFKNNGLFQLNYYGTMNEKMKELQKHCYLNKISNVFFYGEYKQENRLTLVSDSFFVNNIFENNIFLNPIMSNKFYDALILGLPQICLENTYMGNLVKEKKVGLSVSIDENLPTILKEYYDLVDLAELRIICNNLLSSYIKENELAYKRIEQIISNN